MMKAIALTVLVVVAAAAPAPAVTTITVDTSLDATTDSKHTCTYEQGGLFFPPGDGLCTFRRALREAAARPSTDRPIVITFDGAALLGDPNYDPGTGVVTFPMGAALPALGRENTLDTNGDVTISGPPLTGDGRVRVMIDTDTTLVVDSSGNTFERLGFHGGGGFQLLADADRTTFDHVSIGLAEDGLTIEPADAGSPVAITGSGIHVNSDDNVIRNSVISGAFAKAIDVNSGTSGILIEDNFIGTRFDGTVPAVDAAIECERSLVWNPSSWYGGWGIALAGSGHTVRGNTIAGLHITQSVNDTPPLALEVFGSGHTVTGNRIGRDTAGTDVGVCGQGIKVSDSGTAISGNTIARSRQGFENSPATAILATDDGVSSFGEITVQANLVIDGPGYVYAFGGQVPDILKLYEPAVVTEINGLQVSGSAAPGSPCGLCQVDLYLDDGDGVEEALEHLGSAQADAGGDFSLTLAAPIPAGMGLRTISTTTTAGAIPGYGAGTSTEASADLYTAESIFSDGFEDGATGAWSSVR